MKNLVGSFDKGVAETFAGRVTDVGKTEYRLVPPSVTTCAEIEDKLDAQDPPVIAPVFIEGTGD